MREEEAKGSEFFVVWKSESRLSLLGSGSYFAFLSGVRIFLDRVTAWMDKDSIGQPLLPNTWPVCTSSAPVPDCMAIPSSVSSPTAR